MQRDQEIGNAADPHRRGDLMQRFDDDQRHRMLPSHATPAWLVATDPAEHGNRQPCEQDAALPRPAEERERGNRRASGDLDQRGDSGEIGADHLAQRELGGYPSAPSSASPGRRGPRRSRAPRRSSRAGGAICARSPRRQGRARPLNGQASSSRKAMPPMVSACALIVMPRRMTVREAEYVEYSRDMDSDPVSTPASAARSDLAKNRQCVATRKGMSPRVIWPSTASTCQCST